MSRRRANRFLAKPCDFLLIVGQQTETKPSDECVGTKGKTVKRQRNTRGWGSSRPRIQRESDISVTSTFQLFRRFPVFFKILMEF